MTTRRTVLRKLVYVTPTILTLAAIPTFAATGSPTPKSRPRQEKRKKEWLMQILKNKPEAA